MLNSAIVPVFLFYAVQFSRANPLQPVVSVLAIMLAVRLAGPKNSRHYLQSAALSLFCLASSSLFDLSPVFLVYLALMLLMMAVLLVLLTFYSQDHHMVLSSPDLRKVLAAGLIIPLASLPLLVFFFPLLPRTQMPLWNFIAAPSTRQSGFSDVVEPGRSPSVGESRVLVLRAEMPRQPQQALYWRGVVFNRLDGNRWVRGGVPVEEIVYPGPLTRQTIYPEPGGSRALMALDAPAVISQPRSRRLADGTYEWHGSSGRRLAYAAESRITGILPTRGGINRSYYLGLPGSLSPGVRGIAAGIRAAAASDAERLEKLESFFRNGGYRYSRNDLPTGDNALDKFLFETRRGHCEFFASSFALLLRLSGIPSRVVGGYLGGEYNELGGYYLVSEDMAHVWVEAFIERQGWVRVDPSSFAQNADTVWGAERKHGLMLRLRMMMDSLDHTWNRTVISYDFERQAEAAFSTGRRLQKLQRLEIASTLHTVAPYFLLIGLLAGGWILITYRSRVFVSREQRLLRRFYRRAALDCSIVIEPGRMGLFEISDQVNNPSVREFVAIYAGAVYRDQRLTDDEYVRLKRILRNGFRLPSS
jgi:transglutaminase-like putative cysteine protease